MTSVDITVQHALILLGRKTQHHGADRHPVSSKTFRVDNGSISMT